MDINKLPLLQKIGVRHKELRNLVNSTPNLNELDSLLITQLFSEMMWLESIEFQKNHLLAVEKMIQIVKKSPK